VTFISVFTKFGHLFQMMLDRGEKYRNEYTINFRFLYNKNEEVIMIITRIFCSVVLSACLLKA
jgi:hypothetical protein